MTEGYVESGHTLDVEGVRFPAVMTSPSRSIGGGWRVLLIAGAQHADVDGNVPVRRQRPHLYADLARQLSGLGHHVLRYAKYGPQTGSVLIDESGRRSHARFRTRVTVARAALDLLEHLTAGAVGTAAAGHSEGAIVATLLAREHASEVSALICLSGPAGRRLDNVREQVALRLGLSRNAQMSDYDAAVAALRAGAELHRSLMDREQTRLLAPIASDPERAAYLREVDAIDPSRELVQVTAPTLIVHGGRDRVVGPWHADALTEARRSASLPTTTIHLGELSHLYKGVPASTEVEDWTIESDTDARISGAIDEWLRSLSPADEGLRWRRLHQMRP